LLSPAEKIRVGAFFEAPGLTTPSGFRASQPAAQNLSRLPFWPGIELQTPSFACVWPAGVWAIAGACNRTPAAIVDSAALNSVFIIPSVASLKRFGSPAVCV